MKRPRAVAIALISAALVLFASVASASTVLRLDGKGLVVGRLEACAGLPSGARYAAGTVTVVRGQMAWRNAGNGVMNAVFPTPVAGRQDVAGNGFYWFVLDSGDCVLEGAYASRGNAQPWVETTVTSGSIAYVDVPNMCL